MPYEIPLLGPGDFEPGERFRDMRSLLPSTNYGCWSEEDGGGDAWEKDEDQPEYEEK